MGLTVLRRIAFARTTLLAGAVFAAAGFGAGAWVVAGPLDPPAGPVAPTFKTLADVEPRIAVNATNTPGNASSLFTISQPGSYYLTGNITGVAGKNAIGITVSGVTLDLNGFELIGVSGSLDGVTVQPVSVLRDIVVTNGSAIGWGSDGIDLQDSLGVVGCRVQGVRVSGNFTSGIRIGSSTGGASGCSISQCSASGNPNIGFVVGAGCTLTDCTVTANGSTGIFADESCTIQGCTSSHNGGTCIKAGLASTISNCQVNSASSSFGIDAAGNCSLSNCAVFGCDVGIRAGSGSTLSNCSVQAASGGAGTGISCGLDCSLTNCSALACLGNGFVAGTGSTLTGCSASGSGLIGFSLGISSGCTLTGCSASSNSAFGFAGTGNGYTFTNCTANANLSGGFATGAGATIAHCTAYQNTGNGIAVGGSSSVLDSTARVNTLDGINCTFRCSIRGNTCGSNGLAQIHATDTDNRIEANTCVSGATGFSVDVAGNIITRNSATNATINWNIAAGNVCFVVTAATGGIINGNAGGVAPGSTDPNANFTY